MIDPEETTEGSVFTALVATDLTTRIAEQVLEAIQTGRLKPGEKIAEARLARELGTSRAPVREALRLVESHGLVVSHPRRGFFVHAYDAGELEDVYDLRECLELHAAQAAVERLTPEALARVETQHALLVTLAKEGKTQKQVQEDYALHRMLLEIAGNRRVLRTFDQIAMELRAGIALTGVVYEDPLELARSHDVLVEALRARDAALLRARLQAHLEDARHHVLALFRAGAAEAAAQASPAQVLR
ncbi:GntR family transcriptional regulator [Pseudooceanicola nanhaiensis]|uniref:GntR family transcriptional regulator n=1 Tax=Pseudooceanicola nanhaiensis TaxID=375761 RepID=UPI001CD23CC9|nr:GntR family transcriptional regulator [Pseudooceanicola nanhaiensis]MCA0920154.1 GntR family transcriptional regulator [Pseudooceanicola nanhaiensis]